MVDDNKELEQIGTKITKEAQASAYQWILVAAALLLVVNSFIEQLRNELGAITNGAVLVLLIVVGAAIIADRRSKAFVVLKLLFVAYIAVLGTISLIEKSPATVGWVHGLITGKGSSTARPIFRDELFSKGSFFSEILDEFVPLKAHNVFAGRHIWVHYITGECQVGIQAFLSVHPTVRNESGTVELRTVTASQLPDTTFYTLMWKDGEPSVDYKESGDSLEFRRNGNNNALIYRYYPDNVARTDAESDWFTLSTGEFHREEAETNTIVEHVVVVKKEDVNKWNPNKYIFDIVGRPKTLLPSSKVYATYSAQDANSAPEMQPALQVIKRFLFAEQAIKGEKARNEWMRASNVLSTVVDREGFVERAYIFRLATDTNNDGLTTVFKIPGSTCQ